MTQTTHKVYHIDGCEMRFLHPEFHENGYYNIQQNLPKTKERVRWLMGRKDKPLAIVGYGPSLEESWTYLEKYSDIMTMSGAHDFVIGKGFTPTYHVDGDPRPHKATFITKPHPDVQYCMASSSSEEIIDRLLPYPLKLWNLEAGEAFRYPAGESVILAHGSVSAACVQIGYMFGYRQFSLFGMDGSFAADGQTHAGFHPNSANQGELCFVAVGKFVPGAGVETYKIYRTSRLLVCYSKELNRLMTETYDDCVFDLLGYGLFYDYVASQVKDAPEK